MEFTSRTRRNTATIAGIGLLATPLLTAGVPAFAADCGTSDPVATEVAPGICEVQFSSAGDYSFTAPTGVAKLTALVVGAGGGHSSYNAEYAGGGGEVLFVASVDTSAPVAVTVGAGVDGASDQAGDSSVNSDVASGGYSGNRDGSVNGCECGGSSGNGNAGWTDMNGAAAGGAGGPAPSVDVGGVGVTASSAANDAELWPAATGEPAYGAGGSWLTPIAISSIAGEGAPSDGTFGNDGLVILRWAPPAPALVNTGLTTWSLVLGAMFAAGLFFVATASFKARNELQFAGSRDRLVGLLRVADSRLRRAEGAKTQERHDS